MTIDNNPAIRPPDALANQVVATTDVVDAGLDPTDPLVNPKVPIGTGATTVTGDPQPPDGPTANPPTSDPQPPGGPTSPAAPTAALGDNPFNLPDLTPPPVPGSELAASTPGATDTTNIQDYANAGLTSPSRYDIPLVQQGIDIINQNLAREQSYGQADLDELMSSRGLVGSNVEADAHANLLGQLEQSRQQQSFDLARDMASTHAQDRTAAGNMALQAGQFSEQIAQRFQQESQFARSLQSQDARAAMDYGLQERAQQLQAAGMNMDEAYRYASMEMEEGLRTRSLDLQQQGLDEETAYRYAALEQDSRFRSEAQRLQELGMNMDEAYRYSALSQDERFRQEALDLQSRGMDLDESYRQAEMSLREREMEENRRMELLSILLSSMSGLEDEDLNELLGGLYEGSGAEQGRPDWFQGTDDQWNEAVASGDVWEWMRNNE